MKSKPTAGLAILQRSFELGIELPPLQAVKLLAKGNVLIVYDLPNNRKAIQCVTPQSDMKGLLKELKRLKVQSQ